MCVLEKKKERKSRSGKFKQQQQKVFLVFEPKEWSQDVRPRRERLREDAW